MKNTHAKLLLTYKCPYCWEKKIVDYSKMDRSSKVYCDYCVTRVMEPIDNEHKWRLYNCPNCEVHFDYNISTNCPFCETKLQQGKIKRDS